MRKTFFFILAWCIVATLEMSGQPFLGFYTLGAGAVLIVLMGWDFASSILAMTFSCIAGFVLLLSLATVAVGHVPSFSYLIHLMIYTGLIVWCIYEISKKKTISHR